MSNRMNPSNFDTRPIHHESGSYLLRLCADLRILLDNNQPLRADASRLEEWSTHRHDLEKCEEPITRFSQYGQFPEGFMPKHGNLLLAANNLIAELKLRNIGQGMNEITGQQLEAIERAVMQMDCRKRVVFY